ncbi:SpoIIIAH-like family protein [[Clostridium] colinum]|uniref:SpoIIIAH-like family protein n=1 Tax=[Clostridium] colinum TaxID=36835 RepID=UPI0020243E61|nr:SpoIIIAH-like family protein [[Clostridium] colinum]
MFAFKRNQVIITALVVMVGAAGYLNYVGNSTETAEVVLTDDGDITGLVPDSDLYGEELVHNKEEKTVDANATASNENEDDAGKAVFVNNSNDTSYFVQAKLEREQARAKQKDILTEMINNSNIEQDKKATAADEMLKIQERIEKETAAEAMIEAKGFKEVYVRIDDETVDVVVNKTELSEAEIAQIEDIIKRKTGATVDKIRISPKK